MTVADKLTQIAENQQKVFDAGRNALFDSILWGGKRNAWAYAFYRWTPKTSFYPTRDIKGASDYMCARWNEEAGNVYPSEEWYFDLAERLEECGVVLDTSSATSLWRLFQYSYGITRIPTISAVSSTNNRGIFDACRQVKTIDKLIFSEKGSGDITDCFLRCAELENIVIEGVIDSDCNMEYCPLSAESMKSVITHLKNYLGTNNAFAYTFTSNSGCWARLEADSTSPSGGTWKEYVNELGWNAV